MGFGMERSRIAYSTSKDTNVAIYEIKKQISVNDEGVAPKLIFFTSDYLNFSWFSRHLSQSFPDSCVIGMSSYVVFSTNGYSKSAVSAMAIYSGIEYSDGIILEINRYPMRYKQTIIDAMVKLSDYENTCCFEFSTAFSRGEELVMDTFRSVLKSKNIPIFGGTAGAPDGVNASFVSLNGIVYNDACAFVLVKNLEGKIGVYRENMFKSTGNYFVATDVDCDARKVYEFDNKPAVVAVANALGVPVSKISGFLPMHPIGRVDRDNVYITEHDTANPDGSMSYFARIYNYTKLVLLEADDPKSVWRKTYDRVKNDYPNPSFSIVINCCSRSKYFYEKNIMSDFCDQLKDHYGNYLGFSGYGEQTDFEHLNQTMLIAVFE